ncbi:hypothetical protein BDV59DRAFT_69849 [Aspergillus ambiguus]|uniref:uncharacterized protein n=1 Tax=Aspergillus ambiguus TaxID=176160 RepID=UPI003CCD0F88
MKIYGTLIMLSACFFATAMAQIRCESEKDCPPSEPVCCGFDPRIKYCLPEGAVC